MTCSQLQVAYYTFQARLCGERVLETLPEMKRVSGRDAALPAALRTLREARGRSQEDIAHAAGLTNTAYGRIERGQSDPAWTSVVRIAGALGVTLAELGAAIDLRR